MAHSHPMLPRGPGIRSPVRPVRLHGGLLAFSPARWFRLVVQSLLAGLMVSGGVAVSWQTDAPVAADDTPLFTPGPGSVGAAADLEAPRQGRDIGDTVRRGWNDGGLLDLDSVAPAARGGARGGPSAAALVGTEFEELDAQQAAGRRPSGGAAAGGAPSAAGAVGDGGDARRGDGATGEKMPATPDRWAARSGSPMAAMPAAPGAVPLPAVPSGVGLGSDCGWLGLGCASRGMWMAIGGLGAAGMVLTALIVRELYFVR